MWDKIIDFVLGFFPKSIYLQSLVISVRETARVTKLPRQNVLSALFIFKQPK